MKVDLGPVLSLYPMPAVLVGALVSGKPNYITIAHVGIADLEPISFSVNIPSDSPVAETDYCGLVSGKTTDKGELLTAPMIRECPVSNR